MSELYTLYDSLEKSFVHLFLGFKIICKTKLGKQNNSYSSYIVFISIICYVRPLQIFRPTGILNGH